MIFYFICVVVKYFIPDDFQYPDDLGNIHNSSSLLFIILELFPKVEIICLHLCKIVSFKNILYKMKRSDRIIHIEIYNMYSCHT